MKIYLIVGTSVGHDTFVKWNAAALRDKEEADLLQIILDTEASRVANASLHPSGFSHTSFAYEYVKDELKRYFRNFIYCPIKFQIEELEVE